MKTFVIEGQVREELGKKAARDLRRQELIPCVMYGPLKDENGNVKVLHFQVPFSNLRKLVYTPNIYLVDIKIGDTVYNAVMRELQFHPVTDKLLHVDFQQVNEDKPITMNVPIFLEGLAAGVKQGGQLNQAMRSLKCRAIYKLIPENISIDVTKLKLGDSLKVHDLDIEGIKLMDPKDAVVASIKTTRSSVALPEDEEEAEEGAEEAEEAAE